MAKQLIGITGLIGSGKSTIASYLEAKYNFEQYAVANPIKEFAKSLGFTHEEVYGSQDDKLKINKYWQISGREFMQKFGTAMRNDLIKYIPDLNLENKTLWVRSFEIYYKEQNVNLVVGDVRFEDEAKMIKDLGGYIIKVVDLKNRNSVIDQHTSETSVLKIKEDFLVENYGDLIELKGKIDKIMMQV